MKRLRITGWAMLVLVLAGCADPMPEEMPADFDFRLSYGVHGGKGVDTFNDTAVKDLVEDGSAEARVVLSAEEMEAVYRQLAEINVIGDLNLVEEPRCQVQPPSYSTWEIVADGETAEFAYGDDCGFEPRDVRKLRALESEIHEMVSSKEAYQALPEARGAYE
ncbi:hypothetical protein ACTL32_10030 [Planococcus sp. FY231025]|uniref:hypothetical protein n=1 Tax=Planococcus sp. FY231025 TaxID=3455699 RepID=UPI003F923F58